VATEVVVAAAVWFAAGKEGKAGSAVAATEVAATAETVVEMADSVANQLEVQEEDLVTAAASTPDRLQPTPSLGLCTVYWGSTWQPHPPPWRR
jgi:hypothetical protein